MLIAILILATSMLIAILILATSMLISILILATSMLILRLILILATSISAHRDPVQTPAGFTYERAALFEHFRK
eukprot:1548078-Pyramimonas_sp.AAC.1